MDDIQIRAKRLYEWTVRHVDSDVNPTTKAMVTDAYEVLRYVINCSGMQERGLQGANPDKVRHPWKCRCQTYNPGGDIMCQKCGLYRDSEKNIR